MNKVVSRTGIRSSGHFPTLVSLNYQSLVRQLLELEDCDGNRRLPIAIHPQADR